MKTGPIIIVEDDPDDKEILESILSELNVQNKLLWFSNCPDALNYLNKSTEQAFIIISDINLPGISGIDFKRKIDSNPNLRKKSIPFVFYSTSATQKAVTEAFTELTVQGYFVKESDYNEIKRTIKIIIDYWKECKHPNMMYKGE